MPKINPVAAKTALESTESLAVVLYALLSELYEDQWLYWDATTIYLELRDDFHCEPSTETMDRINALQVLMTSGEFFNRLEGFLNVCNTFTSGTPAFNIFDPVTTAEAAWGLAEVSFLRDFLPFSYGIKAYLKTTLDAEGLYDDYPDIIEEVLGQRPESANAIRGIAVKNLHDTNRDEVEQFIHDQLDSMVYQFHELDMQQQLVAILKQKDRAELAGTL